ncbi:MAG: cytochrome c maturation protein CcmE [Myxococcales bacterium]
MSTAALEKAPLSGKPKLFAIVALLIAGGAFAFIALGGLGDNLVYYWNPTQLTEAGQKAVGATIRLGGLVAPGSINFDPGATTLDFEVTDGRKVVAVHSSGVPPQMFRENIGVIVEGTMSPKGHFEANRLMVSHGNEYRAPKEGEELDVEEMMKTMVSEGQAK